MSDSTKQWSVKVSIFILTDEPYHENSDVLGVYSSIRAVEDAAIAYLRDQSATVGKNAEAMCGIWRVEGIDKPLDVQGVILAVIQLQPRLESEYMPWKHVSNEEIPSDNPDVVIYRSREEWRVVKGGK